jgi:hypothetical protein
MAKKTKPTTAFLKDLKDVFDKHNWSGNEIGIAPMDTVAADNTPPCPNGKTPQVVSFKTPSGATVTKIICI